MSPNDDDTYTRELLKAAGPPPEIPEEELSAIRNAARAVWQDRYGRVKPFRQRWILPLAASLLLAIGIAAWVAMRPAAVVDAPPVAVVAAHVERVTGSVMSSGSTPVAPGQPLLTGSVIETDGQSRVALRLDGGQSLRLDSGTRVRLASASLVELQRGAVYVDSTVVDALTIHTVAGDFTPAGTQFEVRVGDGAAQLRVREGRVSVAHHQRTDVAIAGEELVIGGDGKVSRTQIRPDASAWQWVVEAAQIPPIEGRTLDSFLRWIAREQGWTVTFATPEAASLATTTTLHGSVSELSPDAALRTVALSSGIEYRVRDGALIVAVP